MTMTMAERVLREIESRPQGMNTREIRLWILWQQGKIGANVGKVPARYHAVWADHLLEDSPYTSRTGILLKYCAKLPNGRWVVTEPIAGPFTTMKEPTNSYIANQDRKRGEYDRKVDKWPKCPNCDGRQNPRHWSKVPDGKACWTMNGSTANTDCLGRVWMTTVDRSRPLLTTVTKEQFRTVEAAAMDNFGPADWNRQMEFVITWLGKHLVPDPKTCEHDMNVVGECEKCGLVLPDEEE